MNVLTVKQNYSNICNREIEERLVICYLLRKSAEGIGEKTELWPQKSTYLLEIHGSLSRMNAVGTHCAPNLTIIKCLMLSAVGKKRPCLFPMAYKLK